MFSPESLLGLMIIGFVVVFGVVGLLGLLFTHARKNHPRK